MDDIEVMAQSIVDSLPDDLLEHCADITLQIEDMPDEATEQELDLDDPYELLALFRSGKEIAPGVESKTADADDVLIVYRRPLLDMWCESGDDLFSVLRQVIIEELGRSFEFLDSDIEAMVNTHHQGLL
jgi:predicted Zn-dependent protease with MMP-like domain